MAGRGQADRSLARPPRPRRWQPPWHRRAPPRSARCAARALPPRCTRRAAPRRPPAPRAAPRTCSSSSLLALSPLMALISFMTDDTSELAPLRPVGAPSAGSPSREASAMGPPTAAGAPQKPKPSQPPQSPRQQQPRHSAAQQLSRSPWTTAAKGPPGRQQHLRSSSPGSNRSSSRSRPQSPRQQQPRHSAAQQLSRSPWTTAAKGPPGRQHLRSKSSSRLRSSRSRSQQVAAALQQQQQIPAKQTKLAKQIPN
jgi:hypothetical protein